MDEVDSKSQLKRLAVQDPVGTAEKIAALQSENADLRAKHEVLEGQLASTKNTGENLLQRIHQFDRAITRIAHHVGACCGGVDTEDQHGSGGHTAEEIIRKIDEHAAEKAKPFEQDAAALRKIIQDFLDGNYPHAPRVRKCAHGKYHWEDCENCIDEYFTAALQPAKREPQMTDWQPLVNPAKDDQ